MKHNIDKELILNLLRTPSQSTKEKNFINVVTGYLDAIGISYYEDEYGNVFNIDLPGQPILNAHMDTVQGESDAALAKLIDIYNNEFIKGYGVIGGDDKCGVYIILHLLKTRKFNFILTVEEEIGAHGIQAFLKRNSIKEFPYALTLDRRNNDDIICTNNDYGTFQFEEELIRIGEKFGYCHGWGTFSDADYISNEISCANLSVGYYNAHTKNEYIKLSDLEKAINFVEAILDDLKSTIFLKPIKTYKKYHSKYGTYYDYGYDDFWFEEEAIKDIEKFPEYKCMITGKTPNNLYYLTQSGKYISIEGARKILSDLDEAGILEEISLIETIEEVEDITGGI